MDKINCKECNDTKSYVIRNAYDPSFEKIVKCEYCQTSKETSKLEVN